jgi:hypothetical protein
MSFQDIGDASALPSRAASSARAFASVSANVGLLMRSNSDTIAFFFAISSADPPGGFDWTA